MSISCQPAVVGAGPSWSHRRVTSAPWWGTPIRHSRPALALRSRVPIGLPLEGFDDQEARVKQTPATSRTMRPARCMQSVTSTRALATLRPASG